MTAPLWPDLDVCGCPRGGGHTCRPAWMTKDEWDGAGMVVGDPSPMIKGTTTKRPGRRDNAVIPGLTSAKERLQ